MMSPVFARLCICLFAVLFMDTAADAKLLIVIDPGHGGSDTGAIFDDRRSIKGAIKHLFKVPGKSTAITEKNLTLMIARDLARELLIKGNNVILTRNEDKDIPLPDRTALANRLKANVFISIHMNSSSEQNQKSGGIETYILNHATDESSKRLADLENKVLKESEAVQKTKSSNVSLIMKDMILDANLEPSRQLACSVQYRLTKNSINRGVKQALFYVLLGADMPSILIEVGFINSKKDRDRVLNTKSRLILAAQIAGAIDDYRLKKIPPNCRVISEKAH
jgi:N-acetylmuramoyl-L-alanine amidase